MRGFFVFMAVLLGGCATAGESLEPVAKQTVIIESTHCYFGIPRPYFEPGSAAFAREQEPMADQVAEMLRHDRKTFVLVELEGFAAVGEPNAKALSLARATAYRDALVARGVEPARLRVAGYGDRCPEGDAESDREKERRVDLKIVRTEDGDTGVALGCEAARGPTD